MFQVASYDVNKALAVASYDINKALAVAMDFTESIRRQVTITVGAYAIIFFHLKLVVVQVFFLHLEYKRGMEL